MITEKEYQAATEYLKGITKKDISPTLPTWPTYKSAIETKVAYETQEKDKK